MADFQSFCSMHAHFIIGWARACSTRKLSKIMNSEIESGNNFHHNYFKAGILSIVAYPWLLLLAELRGGV